MHRPVPEAISDPTESQIVLNEFDCGFAAAKFEYALTNHGNGRLFSWEDARHTGRYEISVYKGELDPRNPSACDWLVHEKPDERGNNNRQFLLKPKLAELSVMEFGDEVWRPASFEETNDFVGICIDLDHETHELQKDHVSHLVGGFVLPVHKDTNE